MTEKIVINRYRNRKLYDTTKSHYVQLDHLENLVNEGQDFVVLDKKGGTDITDMMLMSVIQQNDLAAKSKALPFDFVARILNGGGLIQYTSTLEGRLQ